jgi:thioredoxin reductase (NADPH)
MTALFDIVVAGGGIAGLSAALTAARFGRKTLVLAGDVLGGNLLSIEAVEGYPGYAEGVPGYELVPAAQAMAAEAGAEFEMLPVLGVEREASAWKISTRENQYNARSLIVATGASPKKLGIPGEERFAGKGVSHCASCDGPMLRGAAVAVVGGADSAMQEALTLAKYADRVVLLCRDAALGGQASYRDRVAADRKIEIRFRAEVRAIEGDDAVSALQLASGERLDVAAVFTYIGLQPNSAFLPSDLLDSSGHVATDGAMATTRPGIFAAGLARAGSPGRAVASAGEGAAAAAAAHEYLRRNFRGAIE